MLCPKAISFYEGLVVPRDDDDDDDDDDNDNDDDDDFCLIYPAGSHGNQLL